MFVHLMQGGESISQFDGQPKDEHYPTSVWSPGERIAGCVILAGQGDKVVIGLYDLMTMRRLPIRDQAGNALPDDALYVTIAS
jgi:hypothetical protein